MGKSAFVAVVGRPSAGKSTLVNSLCGHKVSIVSPVPQTTRNAIRGIMNSDAGQLVFVDTPGFHESSKKLNLKLMDTVTHALGDCDVIMYVVDVTRPLGDEEKALLAKLSTVALPCLVVFNKMDLMGRRGQQSAEAVEELRAAVTQALPKALTLEISALKLEGLDDLKRAIFDNASEGENWYGADYYTDQEPEFRITEVIREQVMNRCREELPHAVWVNIEDLELRDTEGNLIRSGTSSEDDAGDDDADDFSQAMSFAKTMEDPADDAAVDSDEPAEALADQTEGMINLPDVQSYWDLPPAERPKLWIRAAICVERDSQKGILVGKDGTMVRTIRLEAEKQLRDLFPYRIALDLRVKVTPKWRSDDKLLKRMIH